MLLALIGLTAALSSAPQSPVRETLPDGRVAVCETKKGPDGEPVRHGKFTVTSPDGTRLVTGEFKDGERAGRWIFRHATGETHAAGKYKDGVRVGAWRSSWPDGTKRATGKFRKGVPGGTWSFFDPSGEEDPSMSGEFTRVEGTSPVNGVTFEGWLIDGQLHGVWHAQWPDGTSLFDGAFVRGLPVGDQRFCHLGGIEDAKFIGPEEANGWVPCPILYEPSEYGDLPGERELVRTSKEAALAAIVRAAAEVSDGERTAQASQLEEYNAREGIVQPEVARGAARWALNQLAGVDWDGADAKEAWMLALDILQPALGDSPLGWVEPGGKDAADANRTALLRAHSVFVLHETMSAFWLIDAQIADPSRDAARPAKVEKAVVKPTVVRVPIQAWISDARSGSGSGSGSGEKRRVGKFGGSSGAGRGPASAHQRALRWLAGMQQEDGRWTSTHPSGSDADGGSNDAKGHDAGLTGLVLVALMRDGSSTTAGPYREQVTAGLRWIIKTQDPRTGDIRSLFAGTQDGKPMQYYSALWLYDHVIATWALCEALATESTPRLRRAAESGVRTVLRGKNPYGVWRYAVPANGENDTSISTWAVRALLAAERAGIEVDPDYKPRVLQWVDEMTDPGTGRVGYSEAGSPSARVPGLNDDVPVEHSEALTGCGLLVRAWLGQTTDANPVMLDHAKLLLRTLPVWDPDRRTVDFYYWLMGSEAMPHVGGKYLEKWTAAMEAALVETQRTDGALAGSWDPVGPWCFAGGRVYSTVMAALSLAPARAR